jgi:septal ring factor EnvC (AmiA/AmiB activator)
VEWATLQELAAARTKSVEQFEQLDAALARLKELVSELERSLDMTGHELLEMGRSIQVLRGAMINLERTLLARVPGQLPESMHVVGAQLWVVQERFPQGSLPGEPLPKPKGIGMPRS